MSSVTDEDLALRASSDIVALCPRDQVVACGTDGQFNAEDRWTLVSPGSAFFSSGLSPGQLVELMRPTAAFGPSGQILVVQEVGPVGVVLRRKGQANGFGTPPGPVAGVTNVEFAIRTLVPQISRAECELRERFGLPALNADLSLETEPRLREAIILTVLYRQFLDMSRQFARSNDQPEDWYAAKSQLYKRELDDRLSELTSRCKVSVDDRTRLPRFGTRISR